MKTPACLLSLVLGVGMLLAWNPAARGEESRFSVADLQLSRGLELESRGRNSSALDVYRSLVRRYPDSEAAPAAQFKIGQLWENSGKLERAFEAYGRYLKRYPHGHQFDQAVEGQYRIATAFKNGAKRSLFGIKMFSSLDRAFEMFADIVTNAPFSKYASLSEFNMGLVKEKKGDVAEAIFAYQTVVDKYPNAEVAGDALYQIGYIHLQLVKNGSNDQGVRIKAKEAFEDFILRFPNSEKAAQAKANLRQLAGTDVQKTLAVADFYRGNRDYKAAVIYYGIVIQNAPGTPEAARAKKRMDALESKVGPEAIKAALKRPEADFQFEDPRPAAQQQQHPSTYSDDDLPALPDEPAPVTVEKPLAPEGETTPSEAH